MPRALVFYHYLYPDDVVSAVHLTDLCVELARRGWEVKAMPCNRSCRDASATFSAFERYQGIEIQRVWRPRFAQATSAGRLLNSLWMLIRWSLAALTEKADIVIIGTDPVLSITAAAFWKMIRPQVRVAHWCFDLYPEAAIADGLISANGSFNRVVRPLLRHSYAACDLLADLGPCMGRLLSLYGSKAHQATLTPWALAEPDSALEVDACERQTLFGGASLALMYSGNFGRAHSSDLLLQLASRLAPNGARLIFSVRGNRVDDLRRETATTPNVAFAPFAPQEKLTARLSAADIHVVSLKDEWTGTVVPSKFFGALAAGRPVLFAGSPESSVAQWIRDFGVGWVLTPDTIDSIAGDLTRYCADPKRLQSMFRHCHSVYQQRFSKREVCDCWDHQLRTLLPVVSRAVRPAPAQSP